MFNKKIITNFVHLRGHERPPPIEPGVHCTSHAFQPEVTDMRRKRFGKLLRSRIKYLVILTQCFCLAATSIFTIALHWDITQCVTINCYESLYRLPL